MAPRKKPPPTGGGSDPILQQYQTDLEDFAKEFGFALVQKHDQLQKAMFLHGKYAVPESLMVKPVREVVAAADGKAIYTIQYLLSVGAQVKPGEMEATRGSISALLALRNKMLDRCHITKLLTDFSCSVNRTSQIEERDEDIHWLSDPEVLALTTTHCSDASELAKLKTRYDMLKYLNNHKKLSPDQLLANYYNMHHKVVKCYLQTYLQDAKQLAEVNDIVMKASRNRAIAGRLLNAWVLENRNKLMDEKFFTKTLADQSFIRGLLRGDGDSDPYLKDTASWKLAKPHMHTLCGTMWCNVIGSLEIELLTNMKLHITRHLQMRLCVYMRRFALANLPNAAECKINKNTCIRFSGGVFRVSELFKSVENGYFISGAFPQLVSDELKRMLNTIPLKSHQGFDPEVVNLQALVGYESYMEPVIGLFNEKKDTDKYKLTKSDLGKLLTELGVSHKKSASKAELVRQVRAYIGLSEPSQEQNEPSEEQLAAKKALEAYSFQNRIQSWNKGFHPKTLALHLWLREQVPLPKIAFEKQKQQKHQDEQLPEHICLATDEDCLTAKQAQCSSKDRGWTPFPITNLGRINVRIDSKTLDYLIAKTAGLDRTQSLADYFHIDSNTMKSKRRVIRTKYRHHNRKTNKKGVNFKRRKHGLGMFPLEKNGWSLTSVITDGVMMACHFERKTPKVAKVGKCARTASAQDAAKQLFSKNTRVIGGDNGRVILVTTAEKVGDEWVHKQLKRSHYYNKTGISKYNATLMASKPECVQDIEREMSAKGGWRCRDDKQYMDMFETYLTRWHRTLFNHYSNVKFSLGRMFIWRRKRSFLQQRIADIFKGDKSKPIIYCEGDAKFASSGQR